jgi:hypothetical protein
MAAASAGASSGGTSSPVSPWVTISCRPWTAEAMTGRPASWASSAVLPNGSARDGTSTTSARASAGQVGDVYPPKWTCPARSGSLLRARSWSSNHSYPGKTEP